eukprot:SAG25_NODE_1670_length_2575_cov_14.307351_2_plen_85_part_00
MCAMGFPPPEVRAALEYSWSIEEAVTCLLKQSGDKQGAVCWSPPLAALGAVPPSAAVPRPPLAEVAQVMTEVRLGLLPASPPVS